MENTLTVSPSQFGLDETKATELTVGLKTILAEREILIDAYNDVIEMEITPENLETFKDLRIKIRDNRTKGILVWHKTNKEVYLRAGQFVDAVKNREIAENERMEEALANAEKHFENLEKERLKAIHNERVEKLLPFGYEVGNTDFASMDENMFNAILTGAKTNHEAKIEAEKKAEAERLEKEKINALTFEREKELRPYEQYSANIIDLNEFTLGTLDELKFQEIKNKLIEAKLKKDAEIEAQRLENERLKIENEAKEKALAEQKKLADEALRVANEKAEAERKETARLAKIESDKQAAIIAKQKAEADKLAAELKAKKDAEAKAEAERIAAEKKAAKAPDKDKLKAYVLSLKTDYQFDLKTMEAAKVMGEINVKFAAFKKWANDQIELL